MSNIIPSKYSGELMTIYFYIQKDTKEEWVSYPALDKNIREIYNLELVNTQTIKK